MRNQTNTFLPNTSQRNQTVRPNFTTFRPILQSKTGCSDQAIAYGFVQVLSILLNLAVAVVLSRMRGYRRNTCHLVVRVLVISDAIGATVTLIPIVLSCSGYRLMNDVICQVFGYLSTVLLIWTALIVLLMCALRYFAVVRPLFYRTHITYEVIRWMLFGQLLWSAAHLVLPLVGVGRFKFFLKGQYCAFEIRPHNGSDAVLVHLTVWEGWLTILVLIGFTVRMLREMRVKKKLTSRLSFQQRRGVRATGSRQQGYTLMTVVIVTIFLFCYIPYLTYRGIALITKDVDESYHFYLQLLAHINPMLNPILYVSCNRGYRNAIRSMLAKVCSCFAEPIRKVRESSSISLALFSYGGEEDRLSNRSRAETRTTFLVVPSTKRTSAKFEGAEKPTKRRKNKRNSVDISSSSDVINELDGRKGRILSLQSLPLGGSCINEVFENDDGQISPQWSSESITPSERYARTNTSILDPPTPPSTEPITSREGSGRSNSILDLLRPVSSEPKTSHEGSSRTSSSSVELFRPVSEDRKLSIQSSSGIHSFRPTSSHSQLQMEASASPRQNKSSGPCTVLTNSPPNANRFDSNRQVGPNQSSDTKPRGLSLSSIVYAVDNVAVGSLTDLEDDVFIVKSIYIAEQES